MQDRQDYQLVGKNFTPPDLVAKVTGQAKYAEDFRAEGMLFAKLLLSPMPHGRIRQLDVSRAERMEGVVAVLTPDDVPKVEGSEQPVLASQPRFMGEPMVAVAAVDEATAAAAIEAIRVDMQPLPFVIDPLESLRPGGPDVYPDGNVIVPNLAGDVLRSGQIERIKWTARDFASAGEGRLPMGDVPVDWSYGDLEAGFEEADLIVDESFVTQANSHHSMETRSAMAYWQNGKCYLHGSSQNPANAAPRVARLLGLNPDDLVYICKNAGGGFGSKSSITDPLKAVPALLSKKAGGRPVLLRVTRAEEFYLGRRRAGFQGRIKIGFRSDGKVTAVDLFLVQGNGPYTGFADYYGAAETVSLIYQPTAMRFRGVSVFTNTPPNTAQRGPGATQIVSAIEPIIDSAARQLGIDRVAIRKLNAPVHGDKLGSQRTPVSTSFLNEALDIGAKQFDWEKQKALSGTRQGDKLIGVGVGISENVAGWAGYDGLVVIKPDGKLYVHSGEGNLGTFSYAATARVAAEALGMPWEKCEVVWGDSRYLPWSPPTSASNASFTGSRVKYAAAMDALQKLKEIAALELGGSPEDYDVADERVFLKTDPSRGITFAEAAARAIDLGGRYSGHELPDDINEMTARSARRAAGTGLVGVAKDNMGRPGQPTAFVAAFAKVEVDVFTGKVDIVDYLAVADCGTVLHPMSLRTQVFGGAVWGFGFALMERHIYDPHLGWPATKTLYTAKPPTYLDMPRRMDWAAVNEPDPTNPVGVKGVGEPLMGSAAAAVVCAVSDALGGTLFRRTPITPDMVLNALENQPQSYRPLEVHV